MRMVAILLALMTTLALAGCGQTGPLYLPDDNAGTQEQDESE